VKRTPFALVCAATGLALLAGAPAPSRLRPVPLERVCTTLGALEPAPGAFFRVESPKLRATIAGSSGTAAAISFRVLGVSADAAPLRSGELRNQLGLELLARDTCNVLYVMWRQQPRAELVVQSKLNPAQSAHVECENRGYQRVRPSYSAPVPALEIGKLYTLAARVEQGRLEVSIDGVKVWQGALAAPVLELSGRVGLRSDNLRFEVQTLSAELVRSDAACLPAAP
jgi:hypothetical protein